MVIEVLEGYIVTEKLTLYHRFVTTNADYSLFSEGVGVCELMAG